MERGTTYPSALLPQVLTLALKKLFCLWSKKSFENKVAFQKVAFYRGIELYNEFTILLVLYHFLLLTDFIEHNLF